MVNVNFVGRLGGDSEIKESNGKQFIVMRVAVDDYNFSTKEKTTQWINVTSHNSNVMNMQQYLKKGSSVMVLGTSRIRTYVNKEQVVVPTMDVFADRIEFVGGSSKETSDQTAKNVDFGTLPSTSQASATQPTQHQTVASSAPNVNVDDLPF